MAAFFESGQIVPDSRSRLKTQVSPAAASETAPDRLARAIGIAVAVRWPDEEIRVRPRAGPIAVLHCYPAAVYQTGADCKPSRHIMDNLIPTDECESDGSVLFPGDIR